MFYFIKSDLPLEPEDESFDEYEQGLGLNFDRRYSKDKSTFQETFFINVNDIVLIARHVNNSTLIHLRTTGLESLIIRTSDALHQKILTDLAVLTGHPIDLNPQPPQTTLDLD
jgi:hypothetical protein